METRPRHTKTIWTTHYYTVNYQDEHADCMMERARARHPREVYSQADGRKVIQYRYGWAIIGSPRTGNRGEYSYTRIDEYYPRDADGRPNHYEPIHALDADDQSPEQTHYDPACCCCWLGHPHTEARHHFHMTGERIQPNLYNGLDNRTAAQKRAAKRKQKALTFV